MLISRCCVTRGHPITVQNTLPTPPTVEVAMSAQESPLKATLLALMEALRKSAVADPEFVFMLGECKPRIVNVKTADN